MNPVNHQSPDSQASFFSFNNASPEGMYHPLYWTRNNILYECFTECLPQLTSIFTNGTQRTTFNWLLQEGQIASKRIEAVRKELARTGANSWKKQDTNIVTNKDDQQITNFSLTNCSINSDYSFTVDERHLSQSQQQLISSLTLDLHYLLWQVSRIPQIIINILLEDQDLEILSLSSDYKTQESQNLIAIHLSPIVGRTIEQLAKRCEKQLTGTSLIIHKAWNQLKREYCPQQSVIECQLSQTNIKSQISVIKYPTKATNPLRTIMRQILIEMCSLYEKCRQKVNELLDQGVEMYLNKDQYRLMLWKIVIDPESDSSNSNTSQCPPNDLTHKNNTYQQLPSPIPSHILLHCHVLINQHLHLIVNESIIGRNDPYLQSRWIQLVVVCGWGKMITNGVGEVSSRWRQEVLVMRPNHWSEHNNSPNSEYQLSLTTILTSKIINIPTNLSKRSLLTLRHENPPSLTTTHNIPFELYSCEINQNQLFLPPKQFLNVIVEWGNYYIYEAIRCRDGKLALLVCVKMNDSYEENRQTQTGNKDISSVFTVPQKNQHKLQSVHAKKHQIVPYYFIYQHGNKLIYMSYQMTRTTWKVGRLIGQGKRRKNTQKDGLNDKEANKKDSQDCNQSNQNQIERDEQVQILPCSCTWEFKSPIIELDELFCHQYQQNDVRENGQSNQRGFPHSTYQSTYQPQQQQQQCTNTQSHSLPSKCPITLIQNNLLTIINYSHYYYDSLIKQTQPQTTQISIFQTYLIIGCHFCHIIPPKLLFVRRLISIIIDRTVEKKIIGKQKTISQRQQHSNTAALLSNTPQPTKNNKFMSNRDTAHQVDYSNPTLAVQQNRKQIILNNIPVFGVFYTGITTLGILWDGVKLKAQNQKGDSLKQGEKGFSQNKRRNSGKKLSILRSNLTDDQDCEDTYQPSNALNVDNIKENINLTNSQKPNNHNRSRQRSASPLNISTPQPSNNPNLPSPPGIVPRIARHTLISASSLGSGITGAIIGQLVCPIPIVGAALGGFIFGIAGQASCRLGMKVIDNQRVRKRMKKLVKWINTNGGWQVRKDIVQDGLGWEWAQFGGSIPQQFQTDLYANQPLAKSSNSQQPQNVSFLQSLGRRFSSFHPSTPQPPPDKHRRIKQHWLTLLNFSLISLHLTAHSIQKKVENPYKYQTDYQCLCQAFQASSRYLIANDVRYWKWAGLVEQIVVRLL